jgi:hypothetical protein
MRLSTRLAYASVLFLETLLVFGIIMAISAACGWLP